MTNESPPDIASTYGWDTVFGIHIRDVNAAIRKSGSSPTSFAATDTPDGVSITGTFSAWQITTGGDGDLIRLAIPLDSFVLTMAGSPPQKGSAVAKVDVRLNYLPRTADGDSPASEKLHDLKIRTTAVAENVPVAAVVDITYSGTKPSFLGQAAVRELLEDWLNSHLGDFDHVFATVNLNRLADKGAFQWLQPTTTAYAYSDMGTTDDGVLGVLCMTGGRSSDGLIQQVSSSIIAVGARAGFLISKQRVLDQLILPSMPHVFDGTSANNFSMTPGGESITCTANQPSFTVTTTDKDGTKKTSNANIQSLTITIEATELQMIVTTKTDISPGIRAYCSTQNFLGLKLVERFDHTQTIIFFDARDEVKNNWTQTDEGIEIAKEVLGFIALVAALILTVLSGGTAAAAAVLVIGIVAGVAAGGIMVTTAAIEMAKGGDAPAIDAMILDTTAPIVWSDSNDFRITSASLNDSLQIGGDPFFSHP